jgi:NAD(P)-dependent dehydrogenase (short-subunit alcohol dehydrogenase family)
MAERIALVTGANRGIGSEVVRQLAGLGHTVYLGSRTLANGASVAADLRAQGLDVRALQLDIDDVDSIRRASSAVEDAHGRLDVLVNNAAIHYDTGNYATSPDFGIVREALRTNVFGAWNVLLATLALLRKSQSACVVNVSSGAGSLAEMGAGFSGYQLSKVSLNALTRMWADELRSDGILVNSVCPGWVATDMGGNGGRPVADGAAGVVWAATLSPQGPTGGFFRDGVSIAW